MREIKFRLYNKTDKKFLEPWEFCVDGNGNVFLTSHIITGTSHPNSDNATLKDFIANVGGAFVLSQYIGLKDGKEVYQDI